MKPYLGLLQNAAIENKKLKEVLNRSSEYDPVTWSGGLCLIKVSSCPKRGNAFQ
jgi:hypothetical protein